MGHAQSMPAQLHRKSEPIEQLQGFKPFLANSDGATSAPICGNFRGKEKLGFDFPTVLNRADVAMGIGPSKMAQSNMDQIIHRAKEGGCGDCNHNVFFNKNDPKVSMDEEKLWKGSSGREIDTEISQSLGESEQAGYPWHKEVTAHIEKPRKENFITASTNSTAVSKVRKSISSCLPKMVEKEGGPLSHQASSLSGATKGGEEDPILSILRVEDSILSAPAGENGEKHLQIGSVEAEKNDFRSQNRSALRSDRIRDAYLPFMGQRKTGCEEQSKNGIQQLAEGKINQTTQVNGLNPLKQVDATEKRVFWVGESSKNSKWVERKQLREEKKVFPNEQEDCNGKKFLQTTKARELNPTSKLKGESVIDKQLGRRHPSVTIYLRKGDRVR
ncbi:hypothetical protein PHAVU_011G175950 [Phaseolus vulgaris]